jgi:hypothetical protein
MSTLVAERWIFPLDDQTALNFERDDQQWKFVSDTLGPFGYLFSDPSTASIRKFRLKAIYYDEDCGGASHLEVRFNVPGTPTFKLPTVGSGRGAKACWYSDWFMFGDGSSQQIVKAHGSCEARFVSTAVYNNHAAIYQLILEAHDLPI